MSTGSRRTIRHCGEHTYKQDCRLNIRKHFKPGKHAMWKKGTQDEDMRGKLENIRTL